MTSAPNLIPFQVIGKERVPRLSDREDMHYTNAVLQESFRCVSFAFTAIPHCTTKEVEIGKYIFPKGATIMASMVHIMHDPEYFSEPHVFNPARFIDENGKFMHHDRVVPFGIGKRYCLGQSLAEKEFFLFVVGFLQKYDISPAPMKKLPSYYLDDNTTENVLRMCPDFEMILTSRI